MIIIISFIVEQATYFIRNHRKAIQLWMASYKNSPSTVFNSELQ